MRSIPIEFGDAGARFNLDLPVLADFDTTVQNALVNLGTRMGSDWIYSDRGTDLQAQGARGQMLDPQWATHSANFAALETVAFSRSTAQTTDEARLQQMNLQVAYLRADTLGLAVQRISDQGEIVGRLLSVEQKVGLTSCRRRINGLRAAAFRPGSPGDSAGTGPFGGLSGPIVAGVGCRPNSVFGDLFVTPAATTLASLEMGLRRFQSDLDLTQLARGVVFNETFAWAYLKNFGVTPNVSTYSSGLVWFIFTENAPVTLDAGMRMILDSLAESNQTLNGQSTQVSSSSNTRPVFWINPGEGNPIRIGMVGDPAYPRALTPVADGRFGVLLPVQGTAGVAIQDGTVLVTDTAVPNLSQILVSGFFDPGALELSVAQAAQRALVTYPAACLTSRAGLLSFFRRQLPSVNWLGAVVTGQPEMIRPGHSILGISEGAGDVFIRTRSQYARYSFSQPLVYSGSQQAWVGALNMPHTPAFFDSTQGIFRSTSFRTGTGTQLLSARSLDPSLDSPGVSYSQLEQLGINLLKGPLMTCWMATCRR